MKDKLKELHKQARLKRDSVATQAYGAAVAAVQEGEVRANQDFDEAKVIAVVEKEAGKFKESADAFEKAGRPDEAKELQACSALLTELLPAKLEAAAYPEIVGKAIATTGASEMRDMGKVMAQLKNEYGAALDMGLASKEVKAALAG